MSTKLILNGFTINPVTHLPHLINIIRGLTEYNIKHKCDTGSDGPIHTNYLGKPIFGPVGTKIPDIHSDNAGSIVQGILENGYYTCRVWENCYPAKIQFDLFLEDDLPDIDLIIDHFSAPAIPQDGLGLFDYTYSISKTKEHTTTLQKNTDKDSAYDVNDLITFDKNGNWSVILNRLKSPECYFCNKKPEHWISLNKNTDKNHTDWISVLSCTNHKGLGKTIEDVYSDKVSQYYSNQDDRIYVIKEIKNENNEVMFTVNVPEE
jgi:hypothetical protein